MDYPDCHSSLLHAIIPAQIEKLRDRIGLLLKRRILFSVGNSNVAEVQPVETAQIAEGLCRKLSSLTPIDPFPYSLGIENDTYTRRGPRGSIKVK